MHFLQYTKTVSEILNYVFSIKAPFLFVLLLFMVHSWFLCCRCFCFFVCFLFCFCCVVVVGGGGGGGGSGGGGCVCVCMCVALNE